VKTEVKKLATEWEKRAKEVKDASKAFSKTGRTGLSRRYKIGSEVIESMAAELIGAIAKDDDKQAEREAGPHPLVDCQECGEFRGHGHVCREGAKS